MVKKIFTMASFLFISISILICSDILSIELLYGELDSISTNIGYQISKSGGISDSLKLYVKKEYDANVYCGMEECGHVKKGDTYIYILEKSFNPVFVYKSNPIIKIERSVIIS